MSEKDLTVKKTIRLNAGIPDVWDALTNPEITKKYMFACEAISDWKVGSPILYNMIHEGKEITPVKAIITAIEPNSYLECTCFTPENENDPSKHSTVTYKLESNNDVTVLTVTQGAFPDKKAFDQGNSSWDIALSGLKALFE